MMNGWLWLLAALVLAGVELALPAWVFLGLAISVALMGVVMLLGLWAFSLPVTLIVTALLSGVIWFGLRRLMGVRQDQVKIWHKDINDN